MSVLLHTEDLQELCRICCQFLGKGSYCKEKHQENIEHIFLINIKNDNPYNLGVTQTKFARNVFVLYLLLLKGRAQ